MLPPAVRVLRRQSGHTGSSVGPLAHSVHSSAGHAWLCVVSAWSAPALPLPRLRSPRRGRAATATGTALRIRPANPGATRTAVPVLKRHLRWPPVTRRSRPACREDGTPSPFPAACRERDEFGERGASASAAVMLREPGWAASRGTGRRRGGTRHRRRGARSRGRRGRVRRRRGC
jgi:hypothetical protein